MTTAARLAKATPSIGVHIPRGCVQSLHKSSARHLKRRQAGESREDSSLSLSIGQRLLSSGAKGREMSSFVLYAAETDEGQTSPSLSPTERENETLASQESIEGAGVEVDEVISEEEEELDWLVEGEVEEPSLSDKFVTKIVEPIRDQPAVRNVLGLVSLYFVATFAWSVFKTVRKMVSPRAKKRRQVNKNLTVIETLNEYLPHNRQALTTSVLEKIRYVTTFSYDLIFRKYLRYLLNERKFDTEAVSDLLLLKATCQLTDGQLKDIYREVAARTFKKYGILMTDTSGLTSDAIMKKAAERSIFSKLLYLAELPEMINQEAEITDNLSWQIQEIFGATSEDSDKLRITSLSELDAEDLERLMPSGDTISEEEEEGGSKEGTMEMDTNTENA